LPENGRPIESVDELRALIRLAEGWLCSEHGHFEAELLVDELADR
jgi:hypothetical protein